MIAISTNKNLKLTKYFRFQFYLVTKYNASWQCLQFIFQKSFIIFKRGWQWIKQKRKEIIFCFKLSSFLCLGVYTSQSISWLSIGQVRFPIPTITEGKSHLPTKLHFTCNALYVEAYCFIINCTYIFQNCVQQLNYENVFEITKTTTLSFY